MISFDDIYTSGDGYFGDHPERTLVAHLADLETRLPVLDIGSELRTYLEPGELTRLFPGFEIVHSREGLGPEHRHGGGPAEHHGFAEAVLRR